MKNIGLLVLIVFCVGFAVALDFNVSNFCNEESLDDFEFPEKAPFSNEVANIYLVEESVGYIVLKDKEIESYGCGENEKPTYKIFIRDEQVVEEMMEADDVIDEYNKRRGDGGLKVEAVGFFRNVKLFFINLFSRFF